MADRIYVVAACPFEAARKVEILPEGHRSRRLHGHSFVARARANMPDRWVVWAMLQIVRREAEGLIENRPKDDDQPD